MRPSSSPSDGLFGPLFGSAEVDAELTDRAWLAALLDFERELARAQAAVGLIPPAAAAAIAAAADPAGYDPAELGRAARSSGTPVAPLVAALEAAAGPAGGPYVHRGATSQDAMDTALCLLAARASRPLLADLAAAAGRLAELAAAHRATVLPGRTLLQHAVPSTFGLKAAGWLVALDDARAALDRVRQDRLAVQYGGAAGTLAAVGAPGLQVPGLLAGALGLAEAALPWHTARQRIAELAAALGLVAGTLAKIALDVLLLAQSEVAEVAVGTPPGAGGPSAEGGSSAMPHKRNPVSAVLVAAAGRRAPGLVATVFAAMAQEHERAAGGWHAEWETVAELLRLTGGAALHTRELLAELRVLPDKMRSDVDLSGGLMMSERLADLLVPALGRAAAHDVVRQLAARAVASGRSLVDVAGAEPLVAAHLDPAGLAGALDPGDYLGCAGEFIDRALAAHAASAGRHDTATP